MLNLYSWNARGGVDFAFVSAAASENGAANFTSDLSMKMLVVLSADVGLWVVYGVLKDDFVIILANSIGATLSLAVLGSRFAT
jgi:hypothetical protein